jgi:hypothetical protein
VIFWILGILNVLEIQNHKYDSVALRNCSVSDICNVKFDELGEIA